MVKAVQGNKRANAKELEVNMARIHEPTAQQEAEWNDWVASRPECVRKVAERFEPWSLYRMKGTGRRVTLYSFGEEKNGTVTLTVYVQGEYNLVTFERRVFGINPDDLEPCDLPTGDEPTGALLTEREDIDEFIDATRDDILARRQHN